MQLRIAFTVDSVEFTRGVIAGDVSLGGSESACVGLARALQARGHEVHIFSTKIAVDAPKVDHAGVRWHDVKTLGHWSVMRDFDVLVSLRQPAPLQYVTAKFKVLWNQDLLAGDSMKNYVMSLAWCYDAVAYVSAYHRHQWEGLCKELAPYGYVTKNGFDPSLVPANVTKHPNRIIHISRPERGLTPLLLMWPKLKALHPQAELHLCRYSSMYDADGWGKVCAQFDREVEYVNQQVGGITYLGELGKPALYQAIAEAAVMWYPGVSDFAETSCIAAIEAQANGTPFVGSLKGALTETVPSGILIPGVAEDPHDTAYQDASIAAVRSLLEGCASNSFEYRRLQKAGRQHVAGYTYAAIAAEWEGWLLSAFRDRYETQKPAILRRLMHEDDFTTAQIVAEELQDAEALADIKSVLSGREVSATDYATHALDPIDELKRFDQRLGAVVGQYDGCKRILDVACGSGAYALALAKADPERHVTAVDYSQGNIDAGKQAAVRLGLSDQITWVCAPVWDMDAQAPSEWLLAQKDESFDGLWCGEFLEHVIGATDLVASLERLVTHQGRVVCSVPMGPLHNLATRHMPLQRTHVHHFRPADLDAIFGQKNAYQVMAVPWAYPDMRNEIVGNRVLTYRRGYDDTGSRPYERRILTRPYARISAGIITNDTTDLRRCLEHVWPVVDEIVLGDTGCRPGELDQVVKEFPRKTRVIPVGAVASLRGGFSEARNAVLRATTGEWFLWIDSDEVLCGPQDLGKYADGLVFHGYAIPQNHLHIDSRMTRDTPVRMFRKAQPIQFYGCVHEQPQMHDCNGEVEPGLQLAEVQIAHTGYLHENIRRDKCLNRNLPLLVRDREVFPDRELGHLLVLRDYANLALWSREQAGGKLTDDAKTYHGHVISIFEAKFMDPAHKYHGIARPFYEAAVSNVAGAIEVELGFVGAQNGLNGNHLIPQRAWVRKPEHVRALIEARTDAMLKPMEQPFVFDVAPLVTVPQPEAVPA